jgi:hypothetical protein
MILYAPNTNDRTNEVMDRVLWKHFNASNLPEQPCVPDDPSNTEMCPLVYESKSFVVINRDWLCITKTIIRMHILFLEFWPNYVNYWPIWYISMCICTTVKGFETEAKLLEYYDTDGGTVLAGVIFTEVTDKEENNSLKVNISRFPRYTIHIHLVFPSFLRYLELESWKTILYLRH